LKFPLSRHDLRVDTRNLHARIQASFVMCFDNIPTVDLAGSHTAVVRSLRSWETALGPAIRPVQLVQKRVFLLKTEPDIGLGIGVHQSLRFMTVVVFVGASIRIPGLAKNEDIIAKTERIGVDGDGPDVDI